MTKRNRRCIAILVIATLFADIDFLVKVLIVVPSIQLLLIDYDLFCMKNFLEEGTGGKPDDLYQ